MTSLQEVKILQKRTIIAGVTPGSEKMRIDKHVALIAVQKDREVATKCYSVKSAVKLH